MMRIVIIINVMLLLRLVFVSFTSHLLGNRVVIFVSAFCMLAVVGRHDSVLDRLSDVRLVHCLAELSSGQNDLLPAHAFHSLVSFSR